MRRETRRPLPAPKTADTATIIHRIFHGISTITPISNNSTNTIALAITALMHAAPKTKIATRDALAFDGIRRIGRGCFGLRVGGVNQFIYSMQFSVSEN